jgi:hypothetical protein
MAITLEQAKALKPGDYVYHTEMKDADGSPRRYKVNGQVKTWKRDLNRVRVPVKRGLYEFDIIDENSLHTVNL